MPAGPHGEARPPSPTRRLTLVTDHRGLLSGAGGTPGPPDRLRGLDGACLALSAQPQGRTSSCPFPRPSARHKATRAGPRPRPRPGLGSPSASDGQASPQRAPFPPPLPTGLRPVSLKRTLKVCAVGFCAGSVLCFTQRPRATKLVFVLPEHAVSVTFL